MVSQLELTQKPFIELQIEELVQENHIKSKQVKKFLDELEARLLSISEINYDKILNRTFRLPLIGRPNSLSSDYPREFKFEPPKSLHVVGGFTTLTSLKRAQYVDLVVEMPSACLIPKDIKNQKYQQKRALYLSQLAHLLNGSVGLGIVDKLEFRYFNGDFHKPALLISPKSDKLKDMIIQIFVAPNIDDCNLKLSLLRPNHGNISPRWFFKDYSFKTLDENDDLKSFVDKENSDACPSPFYNTSILFDLECVSNSEIIKEHVGSKTSLSEALIITKIWLYQRELHSQFSFIISMFLAYLHTRQKIHQNMSSFQIFRTLMKSLLDNDWAEDGLSYFDDNKDKLPTFRSHFPVVFLSPSGAMNLCYNITEDTYHRLKHEAKVATNLLTSANPDIFEMLFLKKVEFYRKFDVIVHLPECTKRIPENTDYARWLMDYGVITPRVHSANILSLIKKSMTDRIELVQQNPGHLVLDKRWPLKGIPYDPSLEDQIFSFGLLLDAEKSLRIIDIGPEAQTDEAEDFQKFWNPKSQLRLQNGSISETVVWHVENFGQRRAIIKYILDHVMKKIHVRTVSAYYTQLEKFIELKNVHFAWRGDLTDQGAEENGDASQLGKRKHSDDEKNHKIGKCIGVGEEIYLKILNGYNELNKVLRSIEDLKHSITSIQPISHHLRACGVFPPLPVSLQTRNKSLKRHKGVTLFPDEFDEIGKVLFIEPVEVLVTLDSTSKWPNEHDAYEAEKLDYLINLGEKLRSREYTVKFANDYLDVLYGQFIYRIQTRCQKELAIMAQACPRQEVQKRWLDYEVLPRVHGALDQLYREKPAFSLTCRIAKRWISCHLMTDHINDLTIDLLVAYLFLHPQPYTEPASSACGFKRLLQLIAEHNWEEAPLVVNFDNQLKFDEIKRLRDRIPEERAKHPPMVICTSFDREKLSPWTVSGPSAIHLEMLRKMCDKGANFFTDYILANPIINMDECRSLFRPNFKLFHLIIKLHNSVVQTYFMSIDPPKDFMLVGKESSYNGPSAMKVMPIVGLNTVEQFVSLLREKFDDVASFFYDKYGQRVIGVTVKPGPDKKIAINLNNFSQDIKKLGTQLVNEVSLVNHKDSKK